MQNSAWQVASGKHKIEKSMRGVAWPKDVEEQNKNAKANGVQIKWRTQGKTKDESDRQAGQTAAWGGAGAAARGVARGAAEGSFDSGKDFAADVARRQGERALLMLQLPERFTALDYY